MEYGARRKNVVWVRPKRFAEVVYRAWMHDGKLRHASYEGLRDSADAADVYEIERLRSAGSSFSRPLRNG
ncbi:hypothetical protein [Rhizobium leguminosarum]|uniref:ATP dependent DNA ligase n=1 Tax=Rhizobium leguminosarum TaxID=384 RepID=UPI000DE215FD|nr:hypothetical protein E0H63_07380 [Rhizobium leguminosarum bv. viciae]